MRGVRELSFQRHALNCRRELPYSEAAACSSSFEGHAMPSNFTQTVLSASSTSQRSTKVQTMQEAGRINGITYTPTSTMSGTNTNIRKLSLFCKTCSGDDKVLVVGALVVSATKNGSTAHSLTLLNDGLDVASGDVLVWSSEPITSAGLADPGGTVSVTFEP